MVVKFHNYLYVRKIRGKKAFVPTDKCRSIGKQLLEELKAKKSLDDRYYNFRRGGHVAALHDHRQNHFFCKIDLENFFYSISRNRIYSVLKNIGISRPFYYSRWSTVLNPYDGPRFSLPYGFVQSPMLASLALSESALGSFLRNTEPHIKVAIYVDDISVSSSNRDALEFFFARMRDAAELSGFRLNSQKTAPVSDGLEVFNCTLSHGATDVLEARRSEFYATERSPLGSAAFEAYCEKVRGRPSEVLPPTA